MRLTSYKSPITITFTRLEFRQMNFAAISTTNGTLRMNKLDLVMTLS
jgi:hypothetical protein